MPLLRRQPFQREKIPPDLHPDEEVFHCKLTNEIFRDYEKFFERIILCNSLVWSCSITGRAGLTYQEAEESEQKALKQLSSFPEYLQRPILYLASLTHRSRLTDMNDDVFIFAKDRFFVGEVVEVQFGSSKKPCKILGILAPGGAAADHVPNGEGSEGKGAEKSKSSALKPELYQYVVMETGKSVSVTVKYKQISRKKGLYTREKSKLFLKQNCDNEDGVWRVKEAKSKKVGLKLLKFEDIFSGPQPSFAVSQVKKKPAKRVEQSPVSGLEPSKKQKDKEKRKEIAKQPSPVPEPARLTAEERAALKEKMKEEKMAEKMKMKEEMKKKLELEKQKRREEKALEKEKKREEMRIQAEMWRQWSRPRDDLECDDLKMLPEPTPVKCNIPSEQFGDAVMVVEFINCFGSIFDLKETFPKGFTLKVLEEGLMETDAGGLMADLLLMMMTAVFNLQEEEEEEEQEMAKEDKEQADAAELDMDDGDMTMHQMIEAATMMSHLPQLTHGVSLRKLPLDNFTLTEILRLHLLTSGAQANPRNAKFRYQQRGGYMPIDDAALEFKRQETGIMRTLGSDNIYDLSPGDKLKILKVLIDQFLTYAATRDLIEDNSDKLKQLKVELKQLQWAEQRREREEAAARHKRRMEERMREREKMEQRRLAKLKEKEGQLNKDENGAPVNGTDEPVNGDEAMDTSTKDDSQSTMEVDEEISAEERRRLEQEQDDIEADKKAEYMSKERELLDNIMSLQHGNAVYPIGRDRMYRRYWVFKSVPGLFIEDHEIFVDEEVIKPCPQNAQEETAPINITSLPPKLQKKAGVEDGSDKENDSMNASVLNESGVSNLNNSSLPPSANTSVVNDSVTDGAAVTPQVKNKDDVIIISDSDSDSRPPFLEPEVKVEPPPVVQTPVMMQITERTKHRWSFFRSEEDVDKLIGCLNNRGIREMALKQAIMENKSNIVQAISKCPSTMLHVEDEEEKAAGERSKVQTVEFKQRNKSIKGQVKNNSASEGLELNLREMLLDLEERFYVGSLGTMKQVADRHAWRYAIENGSYDPQTDDPQFAKTDKAAESEQADGEEEDQSSDENSTVTSIANDLAKALVQIERGLDPKFLLPPLGEDEKARQARIKAAQEAARKEEQKKSKKKDKEESDDSDDENDDDQASKASQKTVLERWEDTLLLSTSLSQVFLHLSTLEKCVAWSKSALHARCKLCRRKGDAEKMLLCDMCDRGHHMYCLKPPLKQVPKGDWFCPDCKPKEVKRSPRKERRRTFSEQSSDEEEDEDEDDEQEEDSDDEEEEGGSGEEEEEPIDNYCAVCSKRGRLVCCDNCPLSYHMGCARPKLTKVPRGKWLCQICSGVDSKAGKIKFNNSKGNKKKSSPKSTPNSSRQSSKRGSPRDSPVTVKGMKKRKRADSPSPEEEKPKLKRNAKSASKLPPEQKHDEVKHYTTSSRGSTKVQQLKMCEEIVIEMMGHEDAWPFLKPVLKKDAPDYYEIIKKPMDFSTIRNKINKFMYVEPEEICKDVRQIFLNCIEYNKRTTPEFKAGANLSKLFDRKVKEVQDGNTTNGPSNKRARTK